MLALNSFIPKFNQVSYPQRQNNSSFQVSKYNNLAPLKMDTVSFGQSNKELDDVKAGVNLITAKKINAEAEGSAKYLQRQLNDILGDMIRPEFGAGSLSKPIKNVAIRIKTPKSIRDKSASCKLVSASEVKSHMTDIVGARIVMADASVKNVDKVLDRLTEAEKNNKLRILEIENYRPDPNLDMNGKVLSSYDYSSPMALHKLKLECDKKGPMIHKKDEDLPTGYMAIHLLTQLPNGFTGEIQIMGADVEKLKDVEDFCYKVKANKPLDKKYNSVQKMLSPLADKNDVLLRREYNNYTREAYIYQRNKEPIRSKSQSKIDTKFLNIPEYLPNELDFNNIESEIKNCKIKNQTKKESNK